MIFAVRALRVIFQSAEGNTLWAIMCVALIAMSKHTVNTESHTNYQYYI